MGGTGCFWAGSADLAVWACAAVSLVFSTDSLPTPRPSRIMKPFSSSISPPYVAIYPTPAHSGAISFDLSRVARYNADLPMEDANQLRALRNGDEAAFAALVDRYHGPLLRLAMAYVPSHAVAEEVVQETWLGVLEG